MVIRKATMDDCVPLRVLYPGLEKDAVRFQPEHFVIGERDDAFFRCIFDGEDAYYDGYPGQEVAVREIEPNWFSAAQVDRWTTDGLPVNDNGWHIIEYQVEFTMLRNVTVSLVSEAGKNIGKTTLKTGDKVTYYRTDNESWADLKLSDGSIARVNVVCQDGRRTVDGIDIEKVFDGIEYAI